MKSLKYTMFLTVAAALTVAVKVSADPSFAALSTATSAELPAKASALISQTDAKTLKQTTIDVVKVAVGLNPAAAPAIVGSIAQATPAAAATAAATAVSLVPSQFIAIARVAAAAAPAKAGAIVEAICRVLPADYQKVAVAVAEVVPGAGKEILAGIVAAIPELKNAINQTLASYAGSIPSVSTVLAQISTGATSAGLASVSDVSLPRGPSAGNPLVPVSGTPKVIIPANGWVIPPGGSRGYATP